MRQEEIQCDFLLSGVLSLVQLHSSPHGKRMARNSLWFLMLC